MFELHDGTLVKKEYVPSGPRRKWCPPLFFKGVVRTTVYSPTSIKEEEWKS